MHDIKRNFDKVFQTIKSLNLPYSDDSGNIIKRGISSLFSDLEVINLVIVSEYMSSDSENWLFKKINNNYSEDSPLIEITRFNRLKSNLFLFIEKIRQLINVAIKDLLFIENFPDPMPIWFDD